MNQALVAFVIMGFGLAWAYQHYTREKMRVWEAFWHSEIEELNDQILHYRAKIAAIEVFLTESSNAANLSSSLWVLQKQLGESIFLAGCAEEMMGAMQAQVEHLDNMANRATRHVVNVYKGVEKPIPHWH